MTAQSERTVAIGSPEFAALTPEDFDPAKVKAILNILLGPGYTAQPQPTQPTASTQAA